MKFVTNILDVKKFARNLDRKPALPDVFHETAGLSEVLDLSEYIFCSVFVPIVTRGTLPIGNLDFGIITEEDISDLGEALNYCDDMLRFVLSLEQFASFAVDRKVVI